MERPKAHHFIPVGHLARFSRDPESVRPRDRWLEVYSKRSGSVRRARTGKVAFENDLYTFRIPDLTGVEPDRAQLISAVFNPSNKDSEVETAKAEIEERGIAAMRDIDSWRPGVRVLTEDDRAPLLAYAGLLLVQHPTMMAARVDVLDEQFWHVVGDRVVREAFLDRLTTEMSRSAGAMTIVFDGLATGYELNYLAWKVIRWTDGPRVVMGDVGLAAWFPGQVFGVGDAWSPGARFFLPISPTTVISFGELKPGLCLVEERGRAPLEIDAVNVISWARARSEIFGSQRADLERAAVATGPIGPRADHSKQLAVRESVLPRFRFDQRGRARIVRPAHPDPDETRRRFDARFPNQGTAVDR